MNSKSLRRTLIEQHASCREQLPRGISIHDLIDNVLEDADTAHEVAAKTLVHFGVTDGKYNNSRGAILIAISFLKACTGIAATTAIMGDLKKTLDASPTYEAIKGWAQSHF